MGFIYKITNNLNQKVYIGLTTKTIEQRWKEHLSVVNKHKEKRPLYNAINKYGVENFSISIVEEVDDEFLGEREKYWINQYNSYEKG